ncbi:hypothetical protein BJ508DRAFT_325361 [Ascobolus immersus RN42]|uniref:MYND-type domain-containing protein n=1 Tax=Ascobolus immersus RN42 TaxID=1160509 RepID=A0A3N4IEM7_ASCIM|nr:hypothetical protein BJ508DRAFT_325361 [Ascobolus immersus RN42]
MSRYEDKEKDERIFRSPSNGEFHEPYVGEGPEGQLLALVHGIIMSDGPSRFEFPFKSAPTPKVFTNVVAVPRGILNVLRTQVPGTGTASFATSELMEKSLGDYFETIWKLYFRKSTQERRTVKCYHCRAPAKYFKTYLNFNFRGLLAHYAGQIKTIKETFAKGYVWHYKQFGKTKAKELIDAGLFPEDYLFVLLFPVCSAKDEPWELQKQIHYNPLAPDGYTSTCGNWSMYHASYRIIEMDVKYQMVEGFVTGLRDYVVGRFRLGSFGTINERYEIFEGYVYAPKRLPIWEEVVDGMFEDRDACLCRSIIPCGKEGDDQIRCDTCYSTRYCSTECAMYDFERHQVTCRADRLFQHSFAFGIHQALWNHVFKYQEEHNQFLSAQSKDDTSKWMKRTGFTTCDFTDQQGTTDYDYDLLRSRAPSKKPAGPNLTPACILNGAEWHKPVRPVFEFYEAPKNPSPRRSGIATRKTSKSGPLRALVNGVKKVKVYHDEDDAIRYGNIR